MVRLDVRICQKLVLWVFDAESVNGNGRQLLDVCMHVCVCVENSYYKLMCIHIHVI